MKVVTIDLRGGKKDREEKERERERGGGDLIDFSPEMVKSSAAKPEPRSKGRKCQLSGNESISDRERIEEEQRTIRFVQRS